jgi:hypothetical protein
MYTRETCARETYAGEMCARETYAPWDVRPVGCVPIDISNNLICP